MGIETFFFISLAVVFVLLVALVYHFRQKFITTEQRVNNVIEIINSVVKEMQNLKYGMQNKCMECPYMNGLSPSGCINIPANSFVQSEVVLGNFPTENLEVKIHELDDSDSDSDDESDDYESDDYESDDESGDESDDDSEEQQNCQKIVVSDDESDDDDDNDIILDSNDILEISAELEKEKDILEQALLEPNANLETSPEISIISNTDYKKMDISQLRNIVLAKQLDSVKGADVKKMKKADLIKLLEQN